MPHSAYALLPSRPSRDDRAAILINSINCDKAALFRSAVGRLIASYSISVRYARISDTFARGDCHPCRVE